MSNFAHAWIGYNNAFFDRAAFITASSSDVGFPAVNLGNWYSWQRWKGAAGVTEWWVKVDCGAARYVNYAAICGHLLNGCILYLEGSNDDVGWGPIFNMTPSGSGSTTSYNGSFTFNGAAVVGALPNYSQNNIGVRFDGQTYRYYRYRFVGTNVPAMGVLCVGRALDFPRSFYGGFVRPKWNVEVETTNSISERGVFLGRSIVRSGNKPISINLSHVPHAWVDDYWQPFRAHADLYPFIFVWEPDPLDVVNGTLNNTDCMLAWLRSWKPSTLRNKRFAEIGGEFEGTLQ